jgi:hypothetical protein
VERRRNGFSAQKDAGKRRATYSTGRCQPETFLRERIATADKANGAL